MTLRFDDSLSRRLGRRDFLRGAIALSGTGAAVVAFGCGGGDASDATVTTSPGSPTAEATSSVVKVKPVMLTSEYVVGQQNRFLIGLLDDDNDFLRDATVALKFYTVNADGQSGKLRGEGEARYTELELPADASDAGTQLGEKIGFYDAVAPFDISGQWAVEIAATPKGAPSPTIVQAPFEVYDAFRIPAPGTVPPASQNDTAATNADSASLCSRIPVCPLHDKVIADVLGKGRPLVVQFSTPAFCETRFCGPVLDVLLEQVPAYQDRVDFVHIEVWQDFQLKQYRAATQEWKLPTEPLTFFINADGTIAAFLESVFTVAELASALDGIVPA